MENQSDPEADIHPRSSSSSSSAPSSPSSSSPSSSSPSHPQSFASSRSSQKELSAPSLSDSSSTSSSPFSGPSSPAHAPIDQASSSAQAHASIENAADHSNSHHTFPSSSAVGESSDNATLGFSARQDPIGESHAALHSDTISAFPSSSAVGDSPDDATMGFSARQDPLGESHATEEAKDNNDSTQITSLSMEAASFVENELSGNDELYSALEDVNDKSNTNCTPAIQLKTEDLDRNLTSHTNQAIEQCNESTSTSDGKQFAMLATESNANDEACGHAVDQVPTANNGHTIFNNNQDRISMDDTCFQQNLDHEIDNSRSGFNAGNDLDVTSCHQDVNKAESQDLTHSPDHTCNVEASQQVVSSPKSTWEPEDADSPPDLLKLRTSPSSSAVTPAETPLKNTVGEEAKNSFPNSTKTTEKSLRSFKDVSPDISGLQRAKTMPSGSLEFIDGEVRPSSRPTFKRSTTDKAKADIDNPARTPGLKISKRRKEKLMKRIGTVKNDGTVEVDFERSAHFAPELFGPDELEDYSSAGYEEERKAIPPLQIAMLIVGTRGDVQPFVAIGKRLQEYGHRVRLATHSNFQDFVLKAGLEFYPLGGDPKVLAGYMVKNKGFLPSGPSEIRTQKKQLKAIINSLLPACICPYETGVSFKAQAIIANPPAYGHVHVAEALKVPIHIFFTMPWTPTSEFPHPLARVGHYAANRISYQVVDSLIWLGIRGLINDFRKKKLKLRPITYLSGSQLSMSKLPTGYIWSPHLVPKPKDWGPKIDVVGFCFLDLSQDYNPPDQLVEWLAAGPAPIYVGFGSLPVEDPSGMTKIILEALKETSQRGIIGKGWGGIGTMVDLPDSVYLLDNCPHDWLFSQCAAVVHHGGAGTTAAGLKAACPTTIVPFFGDQPFWGDRVHSRGVGPLPIPADQFSFEKLIHAIRFMMDSEVKQRAIDLAYAMKEENGVEGAVKAFHKHLPSKMPKAPTLVPSKSDLFASSCCMPSCFQSTQFQAFLGSIVLVMGRECIIIQCYQCASIDRDPFWECLHLSSCMPSYPQSSEFKAPMACTSFLSRVFTFISH